MGRSRSIRRRRHYWCWISAATGTPPGLLWTRSRFGNRADLQAAIAGLSARVLGLSRGGSCGSNTEISTSLQCRIFAERFILHLLGTSISSYRANGSSTMGTCRLHDVDASGWLRGQIDSLLELAELWNFSLSLSECLSSEMMGPILMKLSSPCPVQNTREI